MFQDQVFCFTPKGDLIALPRGATPIDFAYAVHSQVGDRCVGAKIDGRMVQLRSQLQNGDQVEIITSKNGTPSPEWERFVVTGKARARIRRHLRLRQRDEHLVHGREQLHQGGTARAGGQSPTSCSSGPLEPLRAEDRRRSAGRGGRRLIAAARGARGRSIPSSSGSEPRKGELERGRSRRGAAATARRRDRVTDRSACRRESRSSSPAAAVRCRATPSSA